MKKSLLREISRIKEMMNILSEAVIPYKTLLDDEITTLLKKMRGKFFVKAEEKNIIDQLTNPSVVSSLTDDKVETLLYKLANGNANFRDVIVKKILNTAQGQRALQGSISAIPAHHQAGTDIDDLYKMIDTYYNQAFPQGTFPGLKQELVKRSKRFAYELYNPTWASAENFLDAQANLFGKGLKAGVDSKSGGLLAIRQGVKGLGYVLSFGKAPKLFPKFYKNLNQTERKVLENWVWWGIPDVPILRKTWNELGGVAASGTLLRQLLSKFIWVTLFVTLARMTRDFIQDVMTYEEEYKDWGDTLWDYICIWAYRTQRAVDWPSFGVTSPAAWLAHLIGNVVVGGTKGGRGSLEQRVRDYILGGDEKNIPKLKPEQILWFKTGVEKVKSNLDNAIQKGEQLKDSLLSGQNVNINELVPDDSTRAEQTAQADTSATPEKLLDFMKTLPDIKGLGTKDLDFIKDLGNNNWKFDGANDTTYNFKYDPNTKKFTQVGKEKTK